MVDALLRVARAVGEGSAETPPVGSAEALARAQAEGSDTTIAQSLRDASSSVIILGELALNHPQATWLRAMARYIARSTGARVNELPQGANAIGLARAGVLPKDSNAREMLETPRQAYVLYGIEPEYDFADNAQALMALAQARNVIAFAAYSTPALQATAQVLFPIGLLPEIEGTLTNVDGIEQTTLGGAKLPGDARQGWRVLRALGESLGAAGFDFTDFAGARSIATPSPVPAPQQRLAPRTAAAGGLQRIATTGVYRSDAVVRRAAPLNAHPLNHGARLTLHPEDALALGLSAGAMAKVDDGRGIAALPVHVSTAVAKGGAWIESGHAATAPIAMHGALTVKKA
jgi:NADH-quinone oxidoreductase subunit G